MPDALNGFAEFIRRRHEHDRLKLNKKRLENMRT